MSKGHNIKWRDKDVAELQRVVRNFNAKIARVAKKNPTSAPFLPEKISVKDLKSKIGTRQDFNRELKSVKRFSNKGVENVQTTPSGLTLSKYEIKEAQIKTRIVNAKRSAEVKKLGLSVQAGTMGQIKSQNLKPKKFSLDKSPKEWDKFVESLEKEIKSNFKAEQAETYKKNYLKAIKDQLGGDGYDLYKYVEKLDPMHIVKHGTSNPILSIDFKYDPQDAETIAEVALNEWMETFL
jgi:ATP-dependent Lon protease